MLILGHCFPPFGALRPASTDRLESKCNGGAPKLAGAAHASMNRLGSDSTMAASSSHCANCAPDRPALLVLREQQGAWRWGLGVPGTTGTPT